MTPIAYALLAAATSIAPAVDAVPTGNVEIAQIMIQQRFIFRVPARPVEERPRLLRWREKHGPRCVPAGELAGAAITQPDTVDLFLRGGARLRAQLDDACPALDYYSGFYIAPSKDGRVCAGRDAIRTRMGGECGVVRFRALVPAR